MPEPPQNRCGYIYRGPAKDPDHQSCCYREPWRNHDQCIWHAEVEEGDAKPVEELLTHREPPVRERPDQEHDVELGARCSKRPLELLDGAKLSGVDVRGSIPLSRCKLRSADFREADLAGGDLREADVSDGVLAEADLSDADLRAANLSDASLAEADLSGANLAGADLSNARLERTDLSNAVLQGTDLSNANLAGADLSGADLRSADLSSANLLTANLPGAELSHADLSNAVLSLANLSESSIRGGKLTRAELTEADFSKADLRECDFREARLFGTDLSEANVREADFTDAITEDAVLTDITFRGSERMRNLVERKSRTLRRIRWLVWAGLLAVVTLYASVFLFAPDIDTPGPLPESYDDPVALLVANVALLLYGYLGALFTRLSNDAETALEVSNNESGE